MKKFIIIKLHSIIQSADGENKIRNKLLACILLPVVSVLALTLFSTNLIIRPYLEELLVDRVMLQAERRVDQFHRLESQISSTTISLIGNAGMELTLINPRGPESIPFDVSLLRNYVFDNISNIFYVTNDLSRVYHAFSAGFFNEEWVLDLIKDTDMEGNFARPIWMKESNADFFVLQHLRHRFIDAPPGFLLYHLRTDSLERLIDTASEWEQVFIIDNTGAIAFPYNAISHEETALLIYSHLSGTYNTIHTFNEDGYLATVYTDFRTGWSVLSYARYEDMMSRYIGLQAFIIGITMVVLIVSSAVLFFIIFGDLEKSREELKVAELNSLMYQINPHFIYNTLSNIYMLARMSGNKQLTLIIDSLSRFLRISLSKGSSIITAQNEIEHVSHYLAIQQARYESLFTFETHIEPEVAQAMVLKFILQPLAENSITHGFSNKTEGGFIVIKAYKDGPEICFEISDNGKGIEPGILNQLNARLPADDLHQLFEESEGGYGIGNVVSRLQLYYKDAYSLTFENTNPGVRCKLCIIFDNNHL